MRRDKKEKRLKKERIFVTLSLRCCEAEITK
jgi:hypothetical protein